MSRTNYLVCYDIKEDATRFAVADVCKNFGMDRIQYSVFFGELTRSELSDLKLQIQETIEGANANVHFVKVCASCEADHRILFCVNLEEEEVGEGSYDEFSEEIKKDEGVIFV